MCKAVIHETLQPEISHVRHEMKHKDVHTHEIQHRVLPIKDVQVLPAKHFAPLGPNGELVEIDESQIPGQIGQDQTWMVDGKGGVSLDGSGRQAAGRRGSSAGDGSTKQYVNEHGVPTTETTWIHSPTVDIGHHTNDTAQLVTGSSHADRSLAHPRSTVGDASSDIHQGHQSRAEHAVAAGRARGATADLPSSPHDQTNAKFASKPRPQREGAAAAAVVAARRAADSNEPRVPGAYVE